MKCPFIKYHDTMTDKRKAQVLTRWLLQCNQVCIGVSSSTEVVTDSYHLP